MAEARTLAIDDLTLDPSIQVRVRMDAATVERYVDAFDDLPPIQVVQTADGQLLVADGFHRVEAARHLNRRTIVAAIQTGTREDARRLAAVGNATHGKPLSRDERDDAIRRLHEMDSDRSLRDIATQMGVSHETVRRATTVINVTTRDQDQERLDEVAAAIEAIDQEYERSLRVALDKMTEILGSRSEAWEWLASRINPQDPAVQRIQQDVLGPSHSSEAEKVPMKNVESDSTE